MVVIAAAVLLLSQLLLLLSIDAVTAAVFAAVFVVADVLNYIYTVPTYSD